MSEARAGGQAGAGGLEPTRIALVGHCGPDSYMLRSAVGRAVPGSEVVMVHSMRDARAEMGKARLLLINRVLDGEFPSDSGLEIIRELLGARDETKASGRLMLVSNHEDAQALAETAGAMRGFGKAAAGSSATAAMLRAAVEA